MIHRMQHSNSLCAACGKAVRALAQHRTLERRPKRLRQHQVDRIDDTVIQQSVVVANDVVVGRL